VASVTGEEPKWAVLPLGSPHGIAAAFAHRLGLSESATNDLQQLFPSRQTVRGSVTWLGVAVSLAFAWPAALQNGYELAWGLPSLGWRDRWRPLVWLLSFVGG
jgi:membrane protein